MVIAIIAILAAILFPVFSKARKKAQGTTCLSNVKQLDLAVLMYISDFDYVYPLTPLGDWGAVVYPYTRNYRIGHCQIEAPAPSVACSAPADHQLDYGLNYFLVNGDWVAPHPVPTMFDPAVHVDAYAYPQIPKVPAQVVMLMEVVQPAYWAAGAWASPGVLPDWTQAGWCNSPWAYALNAAALRHNDGSNFGFCDGHAKWYPYIADAMTSASISLEADGGGLF